MTEENRNLIDYDAKYEKPIDYDDKWELSFKSTLSDQLECCFNTIANYYDVSSDTVFSAKIETILSKLEEERFRALGATLVEYFYHDNYALFWEGNDDSPIIDFSNNSYDSYGE
jgi:hypothetical protein